MRSGPVGWVDRKAGPAIATAVGLAHLLPQPDGGFGIEAGARRQFQADQVGLDLVLAAELQVSSCVPMLAATSPSWPRPEQLRRPATAARRCPGSWRCARARARAGRAPSRGPSPSPSRHRSARSWSRMPVKKAILPPGMQKALICLLPIRLTSQRHCRARSFHCAVCAIRRLEIARSRCSCGWLSGASAFLARAFCHQLGVLLRRRGFELIGRHQAAHAWTRRPTSTWPSTGGDGGRAGSQQEAAARHPRG